MATPTTTTKSTTALDTSDDWDRDLGPGWEVAETSIGEKLEWKETPGFKGVYLGTDVIEAANQQSGELEMVKIHLFKDGHGEARFAWGTPRLDRGLQHASIGAEVAILWMGKEELKGGHTINTFKVAFKNPAAAELTA
jgi:hypothetical protein